MQTNLKWLNAGKMKKKSSRLVNQDSKEVLERKVELLKLIREREKFNQLEEYDPYPFQERFIDTTSTASQSERLEWAHFSLRRV